MKLLRLLVVLAALANLALFAWGQGYFGTGDDGREPQRLANQLVPERLRVVSTQPLAAVQSVCRVVAGLDPEQIRLLQAAATERATESGLQLTVKLIDEAPRYWVHLAPLNNRPAATLKAAELKRLGAGDSSVVEEGPNRFVVSLGLFKQEAAANAYVKTLIKQGLKLPIEVSLRSPPSDRVQVLLRGRTDVVAKRLAELAQRFPAARISDCPVQP